MRPQLGTALERLWAPHRMAYVAGASEAAATSSGGCPLCRIPTLEDGPGLVLARGHAVYAVLNLHPYNPGHLMVLPYRHVAHLEDLTAEESTELLQLTQDGIRALKATSRPDAFNVGLNLGGVAGGSLADHLHQHVVPRWSGDVNVVTILSGAKIMPQVLGETRDLLSANWPGR